MIEFKKIKGAPSDVLPGEDRIWFSSDAGSVFVADNEGHPIRMSAGAIEGVAVPVGVPAVANIIYHCTGNGKHYISSKTEWLELNSKAQAGSITATGKNMASAIVVVDSANYYTSTDVEGALSEIGARLNKPRLDDYNGDVNLLATAGERLLTLTATNKPSTTTMWLDQRLSATGDIYGVAVGANGTLYTRYKNTWKTIPTSQELQDLKTKVDGLGTSDVGNVIAGAGLTGGGAIRTNPTLAIDPDYISTLLQKTAMPFLRTSGGYVTGLVELRGQESRLDLTGVANGSSQVAKPLRLYNNGDTGAAGFRQGTSGTDLLRFDLNNGSFQMNTRYEGTGGTIAGRLTVNDIGQSAKATFMVNGTTSRKTARFGSSGGFVQFDSSDNYNYLESGNATEKPKDFKISGPNNSEIEESRFYTKVLHSTGRVMAGDGITVGRNPDGYGTVNNSNKLYLYPFEVDPSLSYNNTRRWYTLMGYNQKDRTVEVRTFVKDLSIHYSQYLQKDVNMSATKFINRSSIQYKNVHGKLSESRKPLELLREVDAWLYDFKGDDRKKENAGFIIERGVPEEAVEAGGTSIDSYAMLAYLWEAVKELDQQVQELRKQ